MDPEPEKKATGQDPQEGKPELHKQEREKRQWTALDCPPCFRKLAMYTIAVKKRMYRSWLRKQKEKAFAPRYAVRETFTVVLTLFSQTLG